MSLNVMLCAWWCVSLKVVICTCVGLYVLECGDLYISSRNSLDGTDQFLKL
jgi:hypothetical protein